MIEIQIDGASKGNPGISGAGIVIRTDQRVKEYQIPLGQCSNHEAEFLALIKALEICAKAYPNRILAIQSDSQIVVDTMEKKYVKNPLFQPYLAKINDYIPLFPYVFVKWIPTKENKHADFLARQAIQKQVVARMEHS